jgi:hypothetical protein
MHFPIRKEMSPSSPLRDLISQLNLPADSPNAEKALKLLDSKAAQRKDVITENLLSSSSFDRAVKSRKKFRDPGVAHRPNRLITSERQTLLERLSSVATTQGAPTAAEVRLEVCSSTMLFSANYFA